MVVFASLAAGIGARGSSGGAATFAFFATATVVVLLFWVAFAFLTFEIGSHLMPTADTRASVGELLRTLGFAATPGLIQVFAIIPGATTPVFAIAIGWAIVASVVAVQQALDYTSTWRAIAVCALGLFLSLIFAIVIGLLFGPNLSGLPRP